LLGTTTIIIYVDDVMYTCSSEAARTEFEFEVQHTGNKLVLMGIARNFAGITIERLTDGSLCLSCPTTIDKMVQKHFDILPEHPVHNAWIGDSLRKKRDQLRKPIMLNEKDKKVFQSLVGTFNYCAMTILPQIGVIYSILATKLQNPSDIDMEDALHLATYLRGTKNQSLIYPWRSKSMAVIAYTDANLGSKDDDHDRSRTGVTIYIGGCLVDWTSHKQNETQVGTRD
jgi:hypothetical protein